MTKNITVVSENDKILYSTYPKRAKGLVKKGRAQWIGDDTIRLCAPNPKTEENEMAVNIYEVFDNQISKMQEQLKDVTADEATPVRLQILKTMEAFRAQEQGTKILDMIQAQLDIMNVDAGREPSTPESEIAREETRQKMLELLGQLMNIGNRDK